MTFFETLLGKISLAPQQGQTKLVAIDGRGGSGKSFLARKLVGEDESLGLLEIDAFPCSLESFPFHETGTQTRIDVERLVGEALQPLHDGKDAQFQKVYRTFRRLRRYPGSSMPRRLSMKYPRTTPLSQRLMTSKLRFLGDGIGAVRLAGGFLVLMSASGRL